jgi:regulator of sigma D
MAQEKTTKSETRKAQQEAAAPSPMEFTNAVYGWLRKTHDQVVAFQDQAGAPALAVDAHTMQHLLEIQRVIEQASEDLEHHIPPGEREALIKAAS